jgi:predicted dehydrogenase
MNVCVLGCGAIFENIYLPELHKLKTIEKIYCIDLSQERLEYVSSLSTKVIAFGADYQALLKQTDISGVIIATPPAYHYQNLTDWLECDIPILCEKPFTETYEEAVKIQLIANKKNVPILINNNRRYAPSMKGVKSAIENGTIGEIKSIQYYEGSKFDWPSTSGFYFSSKSDKGVLMDRGPHVLDLILWWMDHKKVSRFSYIDDSRGGPEANCLLDADFGGKTNVQVRLSWTAKQRNEYIIEGDKGRIWGDIYDWNYFNSEINGKSKLNKPINKMNSYDDFGLKVVNDFISVILSKSSPEIQPHDIIDSIELIENCYKNRGSFPEKWNEYFEK